MIIKEIDKIKIYKEHENSYQGIAYFNDWLLKNGRYTEEEIKNNLINDGLDDDEIEDILNGYWDDFANWCKDNSDDLFLIVPREN